MTDMQSVFQTIDQLSADELKQLFAYLAEKHIRFVSREMQPQPARKERILGLHAHLGPAWTSEDFDAPLPDEFWLGEE